MKQLRDGGRLVVPLRVGGTCRICVYEKSGGEMALKQVTGYANFKPMIEGRP